MSGYDLVRRKSKLTNRVDLRSVMAEAAASKPSRVVPGRTPPPDKRPGLPSAMSTPTKSPSLARSPPSAGGSSAPWRAVERAKSSFTSVQAQQSPPVRPSLPQGTSSRSSTVITPVKLQPAPGVQRKSSYVTLHLSNHFLLVPQTGLCSTDVQRSSMDSSDILCTTSPCAFHVSRFAFFLFTGNPARGTGLRQALEKTAIAQFRRDSGGRTGKREKPNRRGRIHAMVGGRKSEGCRRRVSWWQWIGREWRWWEQRERKGERQRRGRDWARTESEEGSGSGERAWKRRRSRWICCPCAAHTSCPCCCEWRRQGIRSSSAKRSLGTASIRAGIPDGSSFQWIRDERGTRKGRRAKRRSWRTYDRAARTTILN